jgi:hypothetical protein
MEMREQAHSEKGHSAAERKTPKSARGLTRLTPKERAAIRTVIGLFLLGCLVRACRAHGGF